MRARCSICCWCSRSPSSSSRSRTCPHLLLAKATGRAARNGHPAGPRCQPVRIVHSCCRRLFLAKSFAGVVGLCCGGRLGKQGSSSRLHRRGRDSPRRSRWGPVLTFTLLVCTWSSVLFALPLALHVLAGRREPTSRHAGRLGRPSWGVVAGNWAATVFVGRGGGGESTFDRESCLWRWVALRSLVPSSGVSLGFRPEHVLAMEATPQNRQSAQGVFFYGSPQRRIGAA